MIADMNVWAPLFFDSAAFRQLKFRRFCWKERFHSVPIMDFKMAAFRRIYAVTLFSPDVVQTADPWKDFDEVQFVGKISFPLNDPPKTGNYII
jgi:hypothetical protein